MVLRIVAWRSFFTLIRAEVAMSLISSVAVSAGESLQGSGVFRECPHLP